MDKKIVAASVKMLETDNPHGEFLVTLSVPSLDRDGEIVDAGALDPLPDHISFDIDHGMSTATTVGSGRPYYDGDRLMVHGTFASTPLAQQVRALVNEGHVRSTSVAMMWPKRETKDGVTHITKAELLNGAFVPVPANREALVVASKTMVGERGPELEGKAAIPPHSTATTDAAWDNNEQKTNLSNDAGAATYRKAYAWVDDGSDADLKGSYRFIHHMVSSDGAVGAANVTACSTGIGVLNGGRGGTVIPDRGRKGVYDHLAEHLADSGRKPDEIPVLRAADVGEALTKAGRVLSSKNEASLRQALGILSDVLDQLAASDDGGKGVSAREDATGAGGSGETTREDATGAGGDEQQQLALRAQALAMLTRSMT